MTSYTLELTDAASIDGVGVTLFSGPCPTFGDEIIIPDVGRFSVLRIEHRAGWLSEGMYSTKIVAIVKEA